MEIEIQLFPNAPIELQIFYFSDGQTVNEEFGEDVNDEIQSVNEVFDVIELSDDDEVFDVFDEDSVVALSDDSFDELIDEDDNVDNVSLLALVAVDNTTRVYAIYEQT